ncbi:unnamed protein product [Tuber aestivum]|uniref:RanBP2-type domain-containing protein n=1 Tax=Tuber aestivum TaxID=59557 RepID=A0A292PVZ3_9PEZI|nr:unnamed protein product [Tuber aestivum]
MAVYQHWCSGVCQMQPYGPPMPWILFTRLERFKNGTLSPSTPLFQTHPRADSPLQSPRTITTPKATYTTQAPPLSRKHPTPPYSSPLHRFPRPHKPSFPFLPIINMPDWFCRYCGFGPHNVELHVACIMCGKPMDSDERKPAQPSGLCDLRNGQSMGSAYAPLARDDTAARSPST